MSQKLILLFCVKFQQVQEHQRANVARSLYFEAYCRFKDLVYGCFGIITFLHEEIYHVQYQLTKVQAEFDLLKARAQVRGELQQQVL